jgi:Dyp-type peroxidase family
MMPATPLFRLNRPLSTRDLTTYQAALSGLQGNILKSHGREFAQHVFLTFRPEVGARTRAKGLLSSFAQSITSEAEQRRQTHDDPHGKELFTGLYLSAKGYQFLGYSNRNGFSRAFWGGMRTAKLDDPPPHEWERGFQRYVHAMVLFAHDDSKELDKQVRQLQAMAGGFAKIAIECGRRIGPPKKAMEHFGYRDGISQPLFYESDLRGKPIKNWDPSAGPSLVLVKDPYGSSDDDCGTYFVFRKLEQNVKGFRRHVAELAAFQGGGLDLAGAMVIGRFPDGTPLALSAKKGVGPQNDFRYSQSDRESNQCPFFAHIRKTNPRGDTGASDEKNHRIARRGITYGEAVPASADVDKLPKTSVGLLFQCCQADPGNQFEFLQRQWANSDIRPKSDAGKDPVIGQSKNGVFPQLQIFGTLGETFAFAFHGFVKMKGGEYFFAPSISFLRKLA